MTKCKEVINSTNYDFIYKNSISPVNKNSYCKNSYCCIQGYWIVNSLNKCDDKNVCCPNDSMCTKILKRTAVEDSIKEVTGPYTEKNIIQEVTGSYADKDSSNEVTGSYEDEDITQDVTTSFIDKDITQEVTGSYDDEKITQEVTSSYKNEDSSKRDELSHLNEGCREIISHENFDWTFLNYGTTLYCKNDYCCVKDDRFRGQVVVKCSNENHFCCPTNFICYFHERRIFSRHYQSKKQNHKTTILPNKLQYQTTPRPTTTPPKPNKDCEEVISSTNFDFKLRSKFYSSLFVYCKNNYCCDFGIYSIFNKCSNKKYCCANYSHCQLAKNVIRQKTDEKQSNSQKQKSRPSTHVYLTHRTPVYNPKSDIFSLFCGPTLAIGILIFLALILRKAFMRTTINENAERTAEDQSNNELPS